MLRVEPRLIDTYVASGEVKLAFLHILDHGGSSEQASMAAECAGAQDPWAFWAMHNHMFANQRALFSASPDTYVGFAGELGLDQAAFGTCLNDGTYLDKVRAMDAMRKNELGIRRRPSFLINEQLVAGGIPFEAFTTIIQQELGQ